MAPSAPLFWFDYVDPACYLAEHRLRDVEEESGQRAERVGFEIVPPPTPALRMTEPAWAARWREVEGLAKEEGLRLERPGFVPWTRKAHELALHAASLGAFAKVHDALFRTYLVEGRDIGRIDVLVGVAEGVGIDRSDARTILGVDRHLPTVLDLRKQAERQGVRGVPTLARKQTLIEGLTDAATIRALLTG